MTVRVQVIEVFEIEIPDDCVNPVSHVYDLQTTEIRQMGNLVDAVTDNAEIVDLHPIQT